MGTLSEEEMADVLVDINLTESTIRIASDSVGRLTDTTNLRIRFAEVFRKHDVSPDDFNASLLYYLEHIDDLDKIYGEVINRLTTLEATLKDDNGTGNPNAAGAIIGNPLNNRWFKTLMQNQAPDEIQYFSPAIYPYTNQKKGFTYPSPLLNKLL